MYWDRVAGFYDLFETIYNKNVFCELGEYIAQEINKEDIVLECACGTGIISAAIAPRCQKLVATDISAEMLVQAAKKCRRFRNVRIRRADITRLNCRDAFFDKVVAGNIIHLLEDPHAALRELHRVCKPGGKLIIPTYINIAEGKKRWIVRILERTGIGFQRQFDFDSYVSFFADAGFMNISFSVLDGRMPCAVAIITKEKA